MKDIVLASCNRGKLRELHALLAPLGVRLHAQAELGIEAIEETAMSFMENALLKARHASKISGLPALADDSGLVVPYLKGEPGVRSARYAGLDASDAQNNRKLSDALSDIPDYDNRRMAFFAATSVLMQSDADPLPIVATATWHGDITSKPRGTNGFGYDPYFLVDCMDKTAAELDSSVKNKISHRGMAVAELMRQLKEANVL